METVSYLGVFLKNHANMELRISITWRAKRVLKTGGLIKTTTFPVSSVSCTWDFFFALSGLVLYSNKNREERGTETRNVHNVILRWVLANLFCNGKAMSITYSAYVSEALGIQHAMRLRIIVMPRSITFFPNYVIKVGVSKKLYWT